MEEVHKSKSRTWIKSLISVKQFQDAWWTALDQGPSLQETLSAEEYAELEEACGMNALKCPSQTAIEISKELTIPENTDLETLRLQKVHLAKRKSNPVYDNTLLNNYKEYSHPPRKIPEYGYDEDVVPFEKVKKPDVLLSVQIFRPEQKVDIFGKNPAVNRFQIDQEFLVLGSQYLVELRDRITCIADKSIPAECSDTPHIVPQETCGDLYKSGYFYINGVFYNDMRHPDCRDYSQTIIEWSKSKYRGIGPFQKALMEKTRFIDLSIQLGYPYLYGHQGNCEHMIVFDDLLLHTEHYSDNKCDYPMQVNLKQKKRTFCMTCRVYTAEWIVRENKRLPVDPFFFCKKCFLSFNYDENNQKIGHFKAYHYYDRSNLL